MTFVASLCVALVSLAGSRAHLETAAHAVQIGQPFELAIVVEHASDTHVKLPEPAALPRNFAFIENLGIRRRASDTDSNTTITRATWRIMALEGGTAALPALDVELDTGGLAEVLHAEGPELAVAHALNEGEDAPRPARGFRDHPDLALGTTRPLWIAAAAALVLLVVAALVFFKRRKRIVPAPTLSPAERLLELERRAEAEPQSARALTFELTTLLRTAIDDHVGEARAALLDPDWAQALASDVRVPETTRTAVVRLLADSERIKYAGETPSLLGLRDSFHQARTALAALATAEKAAAA